MSTCRGDKYRCQPCCCHNKQIGVSSRSFFTHLHNRRVWDFQLCQWLRVKFKLRVFWRQLSWLSLVVVLDFCDRLRVGGGLAGAVSGEDEKGSVERSAQDQPSLHRDARHIVVWIQTWEEMKWLVYILTWVYLGEAESPHHARVVLWVGDWACHLEYPLGKHAKLIFGKSWDFVPRRGRGSDPIPTFIKHCFYGIFDPFLPKISEKFTEKIPTFGEGGGVKPVGPKSQLLPKICFACFPNIKWGWWCLWVRSLWIPRARRIYLKLHQRSSPLNALYTTLQCIIIHLNTPSLTSTIPQ